MHNGICFVWNVVTTSEVVIDCMTRIITVRSTRSWTIIEIGTMNIFQALGFDVDNHTIRFVDIACNVQRFPILGTTICKCSQFSNTGRGHQHISSGFLFVIC